MSEIRDPYTDEPEAHATVPELRARMTPDERAQLDQEHAEFMTQQHEYNEVRFVPSIERNLVIYVPGLARELGTTTEDLMRSRRKPASEPETAPEAEP